MQPFKDNLYEAFSSTLFIDECGINTKFQAFTEIERMLNTEVEVLSDMIRNTVDE